MSDAQVWFVIIGGWVAVMTLVMQLSDFAPYRDND